MPRWYHNSLFIASQATVESIRTLQKYNQSIKPSSVRTETVVRPTAATTKPDGYLKKYSPWKCDSFRAKQNKLFYNPMDLAKV
jgi:hypothetical protein